MYLYEITISDSDRGPRYCPSRKSVLNTAMRLAKREPKHIIQVQKVKIPDNYNRVVACDLLNRSPFITFWFICEIQFVNGEYDITWLDKPSVVPPKPPMPYGVGTKEEVLNPKSYNPEFSAYCFVCERHFPISCKTKNEFARKLENLGWGMGKGRWFCPTCYNEFLNNAAEKAHD